MDEERFILNVNDGAKFINKQVKGWVSRKGNFYGIGPGAEEMARYDGSTHRKCKEPGCEEIIPNTGFTICSKCRHDREVIDYNKLPEEPWDETEGNPCYSFALDHYYWDMDELADDADEYGGLKALMLQKCQPIFAEEIEPYDYYSGDLPDDGELPSEIEEAFDELNAKIRECKTPLSWEPRKAKAIVEMEDENGQIQTNK